MKSIVLGLGFGDEGKGLTTNYLCKSAENPIIIRFSGGQQAGHTVVENSKQHVFSSFGSGTLLNVPTYWSEHCTIDPIKLLLEFYDLKTKNIQPKIYINYECPITTPSDILHNKNRDDVHQHGSCGCGIYSTLKREEHFYSLKAIDLLYPTILKEKYKFVKNFYKTAEKEKIFLQACKNLVLEKNIYIVSDMPLGYKDIIFEGSQGLLLDQHYGFFPHATPSNTGTKNIQDEIDKDTTIYLVTRAYQTRHGNGFMTGTEYDNNFIVPNPNETNIKNYQGEFRKSILDVSLLKYGIKRDSVVNKHNKKYLVITCLDQMKQYKLLYNEKIYEYKNEDEFVKTISNILEIDNVLLSHSDESKLKKINKEN